MLKRSYKPEEIVAKLRQVDVLHSQGSTIADAIRQIGVSEVDVLSLAQGVWWYEDRSAETPEGAREGERAVTPCCLGPDIGQGDSEKGRQGKLLSPSRRRRCIDHVRKRLGVSERRACRVLDQHRSTQRLIPRGRADEDRLVAVMIELARQYCRYGYRRIAALFRQAGWQVNDKRVERLWPREGLKVPYKQRKRARLWFNNGFCIRIRPEHTDPSGSRPVL